ncbi:hypothetical protein J2T12_000544 [Paenibacillus anaericanus]|nr:hypothetical protein [Paenibacillus anaericanus]
MVYHFVAAFLNTDGVELLPNSIRNYGRPGHCRYTMPNKGLPLVSGEVE